MLAGETESHVNAVNTTVLHDGTYIQYNKDAFNIRASGDIRWRHSEGRDARFRDARCLGFQLRTFCPLYPTAYQDHLVGRCRRRSSRRGYGSTELNTDDFVLECLAQPTVLERQAHCKDSSVRPVAFSDFYPTAMQCQCARAYRKQSLFRSLPHYADVAFGVPLEQES